MERPKTVEIKEDITSRNNLFAKEIKEEMKRKKIFYLNVMASPGSGKTTLIYNLVDRLKKDYAIGVIEADIDSDVDAVKISETGVKTIQMHTAGACHITCQMSYEALCALGVDDLDLVILENVGNLVCPAEFDTGATENLVLLSLPEGDKRLKKSLCFFAFSSSINHLVDLTSQIVFKFLHPFVFLRGQEEHARRRVAFFNVFLGFIE